MKARTLLCFLIAGAASVDRAAATPVCTGNARLMQWPATNPVWEFCFLRPQASSGPNGSGLELRDVYYRGHLVLKQAHAPILNVKYASGASCNCYRDWSFQEVRFQADNVIAPGYSEPTSPPLTVCDTGGNGGDVGSFTGVAAEKLADRLILTTQFGAGWYRYTMKWKFFLDGRIVPWFGFAALNASCVAFDHTHHVYWRLDFDIDGAVGDSIEPGPPPGIPAGGSGGPFKFKSTEFTRLADPSLTWIVRDGATGLGYRVLPGKSTVPDAFAVSDYWFLKYRSTEIDDSGQPGPACAIKFNGFLNGESIEDTDVVVWLRGGAFHKGGQLDDCEPTQFTLEPVGDWNP